MTQIDELIREIETLPKSRVYGEVAWLIGLTVGVHGLDRVSVVGNRVTIEPVAASGQSGSADKIEGEIVGFRDGHALVMPYGRLDGVGLGARVEIVSDRAVIRPNDGWLGRAIDARGQPIDGKGRLGSGNRAYPVRSSAPAAYTRERIGHKIDLGVSGVNMFTSLCAGQRLGVFSGTGIGKSILLAMFARHTKADVTVVGLVGERSRELREFIEVHLGADGLRRAVVVAATADEPALIRREAAHMALTVAEYFRDQGKQVLCILDNITRFAMAQREIGLAIGEPPTSKGYTPSVFAELPRLLERAGTGPGVGTISGLFSVLVEGDDLNEPISDAVRGILDGHIVLSRAIAERGRLPAIDVLRSISRSMPGCNTPEQNQIVQKARSLLAAYSRIEELVRIGAYRQGTDAESDEAIACFPRIDAFIAQSIEQSSEIEDDYARLAAAVNLTYPGTR